jgi:hypothetical protein
VAAIGDGASANQSSNKNPNPTAPIESARGIVFSLKDTECRSVQ